MRGRRTLTGILFAGALATTGCAVTGGATLRVAPPDLEPGDSRDAQQLRVEESVRDVAAMGRLSCSHPAAKREGLDESSNGEVLFCLPSSVGMSPYFVSLSLSRETSGYAVGILETYPLFSGPRYLCSIQDHIEERLVVRLGGGTVRRDERRSCPKKAAN